ACSSTANESWVTRVTVRPADSCCAPINEHPAASTAARTAPVSCNMRFNDPPDVEVRHRADHASLRRNYPVQVRTVEGRGPSSQPIALDSRGTVQCTPSE